MARDANGCVAGEACFVVEAPTSIEVDVAITEDEIDLTVSGGTPGYTFAWSDLTGANQPEDRTGLEEGTLSVTITDANGCSVIIDNLIVGVERPLTPMTDTLIVTVVANNSETVIIPIEPDLFDPANTTFEFEDGDTVGSSDFGTFEIDENGDVTYNAGADTGIGIDSFLVIATNANGVEDTTLVIVNITAKEITISDNFFDLRANERGVFCPELPDTFNTENIVANLVIGGMQGDSDFGDFSVDSETGCITYNANDLTGAFIDTMLVIICDTVLDECVQTNFIATINPSTDTIMVNIFEGEPVEICIPTEQLFTPFDSLELCNEPVFGTIDFAVTDSCITYTPDTSLTIGGMDTLCFVTQDDSGVIDSTLVIIEVIPPCGELFDTDVVDLATTECDEGLAFCVEVPLNAINNFDFFLNGEAFDGSFEACNIDSSFAYTFFTVPDRGEVGPYTLDSWSVNGEVFTTEFQNIRDLVDSMRVFDPAGNWTINEELLIIEGGIPETEYGMIEITQVATNAMASLMLNDNITPQGSIIRLPVGTNLLVVTESNTGCTDSIVVNVTCRECNDDVFTGPTTFFLDNCDTTATVCLDIPTDLLNNYLITENGDPATLGVCNMDSLIAYDFSQLPGGGLEGPYELSGWDVNDTTFTGTFDDLEELVDLVNQLDPTGDWTLNLAQTNFSGGDSNNRYGLSLIHISEPTRPY